MSKPVQAAITGRARREERRGEKKGILGKLASGRRIIDTGRPGYDWITLDDGTIHQAINLKVSHLGGNEVRIVAKPNREGDYEVIGLDTGRALDSLGDAATTAATSPHTHNVANTALYDPVSTRRLLAGLVYHQSGDDPLLIRLYPFSYDDGNAYFPGGILDLTGYRPVSADKIAWVKIGFNIMDNAPMAVTGPEYDEIETIGYPELVAGEFPGLALCGVLLGNGQTTTPVEDDFLDIRPWIQSPGPAEKLYLHATYNGLGGVLGGALGS